MNDNTVICEQAHFGSNFPSSVPPELRGFTVALHMGFNNVAARTHFLARYSKDSIHGRDVTPHFELTSNAGLEWCHWRSGCNGPHIGTLNAMGYDVKTYPSGGYKAQILAAGPRKE